MEDDNDDFSYVLTILQQKWISILMIPTAVLSIVASAIIIYYVLKNHNKKKSPYRRILLSMSACDIISSIGFALQPFLAEEGYPNSFVWAIGNKQSCAAVGALSQFSFSAHWYAAALSFYFVKTIRYGMRETAFAQKYEKWIHGFILFWSISTSIAGLAMDIFHPNPLGPGCWVNCYPSLELYPDVDCRGYTENAVALAYFFGALPFVISFFTIFVCNVLLFCYVRQTVREGQRKAIENEARLASYGSGSSRVRLSEIDENSSKRPSGDVLRSTEKQWKRVKEVGQQSFLYVWVYVSCFFWAIVKQILDSQEVEKVEGSGSYFLPILIFQSLLLPAQGMGNCIIFFRPKYLQTRRKYRDQTRLWAAKRCIFGDLVHPVRTQDTQRFSQVSVGQTRINFAGELSSRSSSVILPEAVPHSKMKAPLSPIS